MELKIGDYINGNKILEIESDPFRAGQINIITNGVETDSFNGMRAIIYRIKKGEIK